MNNINLSSKDSRNITKDKIIVRSLSIVCLVGGFQVATQYFAQQFNYQPQLGAHFFNIYEPWAILLWANKWYWPIHPEPIRDCMARPDGRISRTL